MTSIQSSLLAASALSIAIAAPAFAQSAAEPSEAKESTEQISFAADLIEYDQTPDIVTAKGDVQMIREGYLLKAQNIVWNRRSGTVMATGDVSIKNPGGDTAYGDSIELTESLKDGVVDNLLIIMTDGGRLAANRATRADGISKLDRAIYSPCAIVDEAGCPKDPVWKITAVRVEHDPAKNRIRYKGARLDIFGLPIVALPGFSHPADDRGGTGFLIPDARYTKTNGLELSLPFFIKLDQNRDLTLTPHVYSNTAPALETNYRVLSGKGAYQISSFATYSARVPILASGTIQQRGFRGYLDANGRYQFDPRWSLNSSIRLVSDRTFLRRYDVSRDDRLRSNIEVERLTRTSYFSTNFWGFQSLRAGELQGAAPIVLPSVDFRKRYENALGSDRVELQLNSLALIRSEGQDTQRVFAGVKWDFRRVTPMGQEVLFTAFTRGDIYHSDENLRTLTASYRGESGWKGRAIGAAAAEVRWPLAGPLFGGIQRLTPRVQIVASPTAGNLSVPNEDARSFDLEDSNLFALNRFPGYDRWDDGARITYGADWALDRPGFSVQANIGQSYRVSTRPTLFPDGTGLTSRTSDIVGRTALKFRRLVSITHRYRLDKDDFKIRRNEADFTVGSDQTYAVVGYLRLNRNVDPAIEDLRDREEIRLGGRIQMAKFWSVFGSAIVDLTDRREDPLSLADGYEPVRHRLGIAYEDDCLRLGLTWRRDYDTTGDARRGNTFQLRLSFRNLGR